MLHTSKVSKRLKKPRQILLPSLLTTLKSSFKKFFDKSQAILKSSSLVTLLRTLTKRAKSSALSSNSISCLFLHSIKIPKSKFCSSSLNAPRPTLLKSLWYFTTSTPIFYPQFILLIVKKPFKSSFAIL